MFRRTIANEIQIKGIGQYNGEVINVKLKPAKVNDGIFFTIYKKGVNNSKNNVIKIGDKSNKYDTSNLNTTISNGNVEIKMIEHLMSSFWAFKITDCEIEIDSDEIPMLDGSAKYWCFLISCAGVKEFDGIVADVIDVKEEITIKSNGAEITAKPCDRLKITYEIDFDVKTIGHNIFTFDENCQSYSNEIALARTFCTEEQVVLHKKLKKHFSIVDMVVFGNDKVISHTGILNFKNEPTRHKILDIIGDLMNCGKFVRGEFICKKSGHSTNRMIVEKILELNS